MGTPSRKANNHFVDRYIGGRDVVFSEIRCELGRQGFDLGEPMFIWFIGRGDMKEAFQLFEASESHKVGYVMLRILWRG